MILYSLVPTRLPQLCLLHHCSTQMVSEVTEIIRMSIFSFLVGAKVSISGSFSEAMASIA